MTRVLPVLVIAALLALDGYLYGVFTHRWGPTRGLELAAARLDDVPMTIGDWQGEAARPLTAREAEQAGFASYIHRSYKNRKNGAAVSVLLACGPAGPLSVHTPDVCYRGSGYQAVGDVEKRREQVNGPFAADAEFWAAKFSKPDSASFTDLRVLWCWNSGRGWQAPQTPRIAFAGTSALYKLYVVQEVIRDEGHSERVSGEFLGQLLPELNKRLFPGS